jgi:quinol monooxygenase YgiN
MKVGHIDCRERLVGSSASLAPSRITHHLVRGRRVALRLPWRPMIVEYVRYRVPPERAQALEDAYQAAAESLRASPHCLAFELSRSLEEPGRYVLRIEWDSVEGHLEGFRKSPEFTAFLRHVRPFIPDLEEMKHYERVEAVGTKTSTT